MNEYVTSNGLVPVIAIISSNGAEKTANRNNLSFTDLLTPFCRVQTNISDPSGQQSSFKLQIGLRDIKRNGYLLSFTVLPSVLQETVRLRLQTGDDAWTNGFNEFFHYWQEPSSHDFLKSYICAIFVVSVNDSDPLGELNNLIQQQNYQQHGSTESANSLSPAHCASPKWFLPQILKYYVMVQDVLKDDDEKTKTAFASICSTYGQQFCYHLKINSTENSNMPDPWSKLLVDRYRGLENGLEVARRELLTKNNASPHTLSHDLTSLNVSSIATVSSADINTLPLNLENNVPKRPANPPTTTILPGVKRGDCLDTDDRERIGSFIEHFVKNVLVPFVERQLVTQNEAMMNRRGIGKSVTNMKKWLNFGSTAPQLSSNQTNISYANESPEMQTRRLADLAFLFGRYTYSNQLYQTLKKDFLNDQAWLHHAGALEMAALSSFLSSSTPTQFKNYPARYMENAIEFYANTCAQSLLAVRCVLYSAEILVHLEKFTDAANQIIRITSGLPDIYGAVFLERAATLFSRCKMFRREAFHSVLAGHRYEKSDLMQLAFQCYNKALPEYMDKSWTNAEDNVLCVVSRDPSLKAEDRIECSKRLVRQYCLNQSEEQQEIFLKNYLRQTTDEGRILNVPIVNGVETFFGSNPTALNDDDLTKQEYSITPDGMDVIPDPTWTDIEKAASQSCLGPSFNFRPNNNFANSLTNNTELNSMPANEKFTIRLKLVNPLKIPLKLRHLCLGFEEVNTSNGQPFSYISEIVELDLPGISMLETTSMSSGSLYSMDTHEVNVELICIPTEACKSFTVNSLKFEIAVGETLETFRAQIPISASGKRLFNNKAEMTSKIYSADNRLKAQISSQPHPLLHFQLPNNSSSDQLLEVQTTSLNLFCSQTYQLNLQISNNGNCDVDRLFAAYDRPELITFYDSKADRQFPIDNNKGSPGVFTSRLNQGIRSGESVELTLIIHAPSLPVTNTNLKLVFLYSSNGVARQWRHKIDITTTALLQTEISVLDLEDKLCALKVKNSISSRDSILVQIECLRLEAKIKSSNGYFADLHPLSNRKVILDTDQSDLYCFYVRFTKDSPRSIIINDDKSKLHWPYLSNPSNDHLQFLLSWRAKITKDTTSSIHGQSIISNPFILFPQEDLNALWETSTPNILIQTRLLRQVVSIPVKDNEELKFALTHEECRKQANKQCTTKSLPDEIKIPWSIEL